jgi:protein ImuA
MSAVLRWTGDDDALPVQGVAHPSRSSRSRARRSLPSEGPAELPPEVEQALWRGCDLGRQAGRVLSSGFAALDAELPGGGWPCGALTEVLSPQPAVLEWRLVGPSLAAVVAADRPVVLIGPPRMPHLPGLQHLGIGASQLVWIQAEAPAQRLWCTEQLVKSGACGALLAWLPQARPDQIRRLQVAASGGEAPVFLFRPAAAQHESSAAPLRLLASFGVDWTLQVHLLKRRGPAHEGELVLDSVPGGLGAVLTPRLRRPSRWLAGRDAVPLASSPVSSDTGGAVHALGSPAPGTGPRSAVAQR